MALKPESMITPDKGTGKSMTALELKSLAVSSPVDSPMDSELYFMYLPKGGLTNQMMEFWKAIIIANRLGRTLIYPPMLASLHDTGGHTQNWADYFDMEYLLSHFPRTKLIKIEEAPKGLLPDKWTLLRKDNIMSLGMTARRLCLLYSWDCESNWISLELEDTPSLEKYIEAVQSVTGGRESKDVPVPLKKIGKGRKAPMIPYRRMTSGKDKVVVVTPLLKVHSSKDWTDVGRYMRFNEKVVSIATKKIQGLIGNQEFISVHWRRADFDEYCQTFAKSRQKHCWPSIEMAMELMMDVRRREMQSIKGSKLESGSGLELKSKSLPIIITTNTIDAHELDIIKKQDNVHIFVHDDISDLGVFGKAMVDACVPTLSNARVFIGNSYSTFSKMAAKRRQAWNKYGSRGVKSSKKSPLWKEMPGRVVYF